MPVPDVWRLGTGEERARVAIVGCGGAGCNTLRHVVPPPNAERVALNDAPHPSMVGVPRRVLVRPDPLRALASMDEQAVRKMETHEEKDVAAAILDRDLVVVLGGLGGEVGGWGMGLVGRVARILGDACVAMATLPFRAEGMLRRQASEAQLELLRRKADGVVTFANDHLLRLAPDLPLAKSFAVLGTIMARAASGLASALSRDDTVPLRRFLSKSRDWRFGMGAGTEKHRCFLAVEEAYTSPWFTGRPEDMPRLVVLMGLPSSGLVEEVLREVHLRSPLADVAWCLLPERMEGDRVVLQILAGVTTTDRSETRSVEFI